MIPKESLQQVSKETLEKRGYETHILNLVNPDLSMSYNPLQLVIEAYKKGDYESVAFIGQYIIFHSIL